MAGRKWLRKALSLGGGGVLAAVLGLGILSLLSCRAPQLGVEDGRLLPCPSSPNCVSSQDPDPEHRIEPIAFSGDADAAWARPAAVLDEWPRTTTLETEAGYLRVESKSRVFRFRDDMEFLLDPAASVIHVRAAARAGYSDMGANRRRIEAIRQAFRE